MEQHLERARGHYTAAWKIDNGMPETYAMTGDTYLMSGFNTERAIQLLEEALFLLPSDLEVRLKLANAYASDGRYDEALNEARFVQAWSHGASSLTRASAALIDMVESVQSLQQGDGIPIPVAPASLSSPDPMVQGR